MPEKGEINKMHITGKKGEKYKTYCINAVFEKRCTFNGPPQKWNNNSLCFLIFSLF